MRKRGLSEKVVWAHNPLPAITDAEVLQLADLPMATPKNKSPFELRWQYAGGEEREDIVLEPGEFHPLRVSESLDIEREMREQGLVLVNDQTDKAEVLAKAEQGLRIAQKFWRERGAPKLQQYRQRAGITEDEMGERRYELWAYHVAKAKAKLLEEATGRVVAARAKLLRSGAEEKVEEASASIRAKANARAAAIEASV